MEIFTGAKGSGKTTQLIHKAATEYLYIVCADRRRVDSIWSLARELVLDIPFPLTFEEFVGKRFQGRGIRGFLIDDADELLQYLAGGVRVVGFSCTSDPNPPLNPSEQINQWISRL